MTSLLSRTRNKFKPSDLDLIKKAFGIMKCSFYKEANLEIIYVIAANKRSEIETDIDRNINYEIELARIQSTKNEIIVH